MRQWPCSEIYLRETFVQPIPPRRSSLIARFSLFCCRTTADNKGRREAKTDVLGVPVCIHAGIRVPATCAQLTWTHGYRRDPAPETTAINYATKLSHRLITLRTCTRPVVVIRTSSERLAGEGERKRTRQIPAHHRASAFVVGKKSVLHLYGKFDDDERDTSYGNHPSFSPARLPSPRL